MAGKNILSTLLNNNLVPILTIVGTIVIAYINVGGTSDDFKAKLTTHQTRLEKLEKTPPTFNYEAVNRMIKSESNNLEKVLTIKINSNKEMLERDLKNLREVFEIEMKSKVNKAPNGTLQYKKK